jgi:hypothetical protein
MLGHKYTPENLFWSESRGVVNATESTLMPGWIHYSGEFTMGASTKELFEKEFRPIMVRKEVTQQAIEHCWTMYQQGQISADHTDKQVFEQTLQSFANWLFT